MPKTIGRSLMRQAVLLIEEGDDLEGSLGDHLGKSVSGERHWRETGLEFGERLAITIHSVGGHTYAPHGSGGLGLVIKNVEFTMKVALEGPWFVGRLKIEGRGQILRSTSQWCAHAVAA